MDRDEAIQKARTEAEGMYRNGQFLCSEAVFLVTNEYLGKPVSDVVVKLASGFPVGMGMAGCACGDLTGGVMLLGLKYGRMQAAAIELLDRFIARGKVSVAR